MAIPLVINGQTFEYPVDFDENWGINATGWAQAVTNGMLQRAGGNFPLIADVNFGASFGLIAPYFTSHTTLPSITGVIRLAKTDTVEWRNNANSADNILAVNSSDQLEYNGVVIGAATGVTSITGTANEIIASSSTGNITLSTPQAIGTGSSPSFVTVTANLTGNVIGTVTGHSTLDLALTGGTMSGAVAMGANKITGLANGSLAQDAVALSQLSSGNAITAGGITNATITTTQVASNTIAGSTANSGGSAGNIAQGTISTADFRANAVSQILRIDDGTTGSSASFTDIASQAITTLANSTVLVTATATIVVSNAAGLSGIQLIISQGGTYLAGGRQIMNVTNASGNTTFALTCSGYQQPGAGTFTYKIQYGLQNGAVVNVNNYSLTITELRA